MPAFVVPAVGVADAVFSSVLLRGPLGGVVVFAAAAALVLACAFTLWRMWRSLRASVLRHGGLVCPRCRYPLDRLPESVDRCPECGTAHDRRETVSIWRSFCRFDPTELPADDDK